MEKRKSCFLNAIMCVVVENAREFFVIPPYSAGLILTLGCDE